MITRHATYRQSALVLLMGLGLTACSGDKMGSSNEAFSTAADVHDNEDVIVATREIDELLQQRGDAILGGQKPLFDVETELLQGKGGPWSESKDEQALDQARNAYFGDLHVHTTYSFDGYAFGTLATPYDAYRFARGEAIKNPAGYEMQLTRPMDFYAVTDHGMFLGVVQAAADTSTDFSKNPFSEPYHDLNAPDNFGTGFFSRMKRLLTFSGFIPQIISGISGGSIDRGEVLNVVRTAWEDTIVAADQFNSPGEFTTFAAYEYTTSSVGMGNLHRNVIFDGTESLPREPFSRFHSSNPEDLWDWMDELRAKGVESLAIPHNSNGSNGLMFQTNDFAGNAFDKTYVEQRSRNEPIVEITQIKGTSETHPTLSSRDEWAGFEIMPYRVATAALSQLEGSYVREALLNGLAIEKQGVGNPYGFGFIGSSDTHSAASQNDESNFVSKLGILSSTAEQRGSVPFKGIDGQFAYYASYLATRLYPTPLGKNMYVKIDGDVYTSGSTPTFGAAGLAAAWAEENTRESLYSAFRRKEVFATSGPRIRLRFFAGYDFDEAMLSAPDGVEQAYAKGVTMGGSLVGNGTESPGFLVMASADPKNAPLQRLQIIKGWIDDDGATHEEVIDVACANGAEVNPETGSDQLSTLWYDPNFKSDQRAFYYARVLENPTCRWSTWDAIRAGVAPRPDFAKTVQERAWSSPIHYLKD